jgi:hypothetical protein
MYKHTVLRTGACTSFGATARSRRERRISAVQADRHVAAPATASSICVARSVPRHTCMTIYYCQQCRVACMHASHEPARWRRDFCKGRRTAPHRTAGHIDTRSAGKGDGTLATVTFFPNVHRIHQTSTTRTLRQSLLFWLPSRRTKYVQYISIKFPAQPATLLHVVHPSIFTPKGQEPMGNGNCCPIGISRADRGWYTILLTNTVLL